MQDYLRDPGEIYRRSFAAIRGEADLGPLPPDIAAVATRLIHACGMTDIVADLVFTADVAAKCRAALDRGAAILADTAMTAAGIMQGRLPAGNEVICTLHDAATAGHAEALGTTRSAAAVDFWTPHRDGAVVAIGNAPTALFRLLEVIAEGAPSPAAVLAFPVGFIGAAEAKEALIAAQGAVGHAVGDAVPFLTLRGRRGGSAMAAAAVNALALGTGDGGDT